MKYKIRISFITLFMCVLFFISFGMIAAKEAAADNPSASQPVRILFIGNSHTYFNDMPRMVYGLAKADGIECDIRVIASNAYTFYKFANPSDEYGAQVYAALSTEKWDYVVLQENRKKIVEKRGSSENGAEILFSLIEKAGAKPVIYVPHSDRVSNYFTINGKNMFLTNYQIGQMVSKNNFFIANRYGAGVADYCNHCMWTLQNYPDVNLYISDMIHPSVRGSYLAACTIYYELFNKSPYGNKFLPENDSSEKDNHIYDITDAKVLLKGMDNEDALFLQSVADTKIVIDRYYTQVKKGDFGYLTAKVVSDKENILLRDYKNNITWSSVDTAGLAVNKVTGEFTALASGKHLMAAHTDSGLISYALIDVKQPSETFYINNGEMSVTLKRGEKLNYTYSIFPADTTDSVTWVSENPSVAVVDADGKVTALNAGVAKIQATTTSGLLDYVYVRVKLDTPTKLKVKNITKKPKKKKYANISVKWKASEGAVKYNVYRKSLKQKKYKKIAAVKKNSYTDKKRKKNNTYYYKIKAVFPADTKCNSDFSAEKKITVKKK